jgi:DNA invertase Pin-like site-specific DNA recombinase
MNKVSGAVIYTRVSTGDQDKHGTSPETQLDACRAKALALRLPIIAEYYDGAISGGFLLSRTEFQAALGDIQAGRADTLICPNISRYSRDVEHQQAVKKAIRAVGGQLVFCDMTFEDNASGDLNFTIQGGFAEYEKAMIKERTVGGRVKKAKQGIQPARTSSPFGYHIVSKPDVLAERYPVHTLGTYLVIEEEAALVRDLFGGYVSGGTLPSLARRLNESGVPTRKGGLHWRPSTLRFILTNPVYKGVGAYGKTHHSFDETRIGRMSERSGKTLTSASIVRPADPAAWITWTVPALVSEEHWDAVQERLAQNRRKASGNPRRVRMLAGRVLCPACGSGLTVTHHLIGGRLQNGGQRVPTYICGMYQDKIISTGQRGCLPTSYPVEAVEDAVQAALLDAIRRPDAVAAALAAYREALPAAVPGDAARNLAAVERTLALLEKKQAAAVQGQIAGIMAGADPAAYTAVFAEIAAQRTELEKKRQVLTRAAGRTPHRPPASATAPVDLSHILADVRRVLASPDITDADKRTLLGTVITAVCPAKTQGTLTVRVDFLPRSVLQPQETLQSIENDNNKNRKYPVVDARIKDTYAKDSKATLNTKLYDAYVRFFRWAADRLQGQDGIVCFVTNNSFVDQIAFDGMRKHLLQDYTQIYHLDLHGNVRKNPKLSGTTHNVFGIQVGAGITVAIRRRENPERFLKYYRVPEDWRKPEKLEWLTQKQDVTGIDWQTLQPDTKQNWITEGMQADFEDFLPIASKEAKASKSGEVQAIFKTYSLGVSTNRDSIVYDYNKPILEQRIAIFLNQFNDEVGRWVQEKRPTEVDAFLDYSKIKWSEHLKNELRREKRGELNEKSFRPALYRPFNTQWLYYDGLLVDRPGGFDKILPSASIENTAICLSGVGSSKLFGCLMTQVIPGLDLLEKTQCFPLYTYALDGKLRRDNITDWALAQFQAKYGPDVTKRDIFHYVYGLLHSPEYRERYKENLKRELPRIPLVEEPTPAHKFATPPETGRERGSGEEPTTATGLNSSSSRFGRTPVTEERGNKEVGSEANKEVGSFRTFAAVGAQLAALHVGYEQAPEYPLTQLVNKDVPFSWRVTKMRLNKDKTAVVVNEALTLGGIPAEAFEYKLGNRSALEWVLDQYQVSTDKRSEIVTDPNRADDPEYIVRLVCRVITVSVETARLVASLPPLVRAMTDEREPS